jgi:hypothetical protein
MRTRIDAHPPVAPPHGVPGCADCALTGPSAGYDTPMGWIPSGPVRRWELDAAREAYPTSALRRAALGHARLHHDYASLAELCSPHSAPVLWGAESQEAHRMLGIASEACQRAHIGRPSSWIPAWRTILVLSTLEVSS